MTEIYTKHLSIHSLSQINGLNMLMLKMIGEITLKMKNYTQQTGTDLITSIENLRKGFEVFLFAYDYSGSNLSDIFPIFLLHNDCI